MEVFCDLLPYRVNDFVRWEVNRILLPNARN
jgi:hypothetical protein